MGISRIVETVGILSMLPILRASRRWGGNGFVSPRFCEEGGFFPWEDRWELRFPRFGLWFCWHLLVSLLYFICSRRCQEIEGVSCAGLDCK